MKDSSKTNWKLLRNNNDSLIDYSDIPESEPEFWEDAQVFYPQKKVEIIIKIDEDIAEWLGKLGDKSDNAVNNLLRSYFIGLRNLSSGK